MINYSIFIMGTTPGTKKQDITETKAYGVAQSNETLDLDKFAKHITDHGCAYDRGDVAAILTKSVDCLREMMLAGKRVKLGDLGTFHAELACEGARTTDEFNSNNIKEVNVRWTPGKRFQNLRSDAEFRLVPSRVAQADAVPGVEYDGIVERISDATGSAFSLLPIDNATGNFVKVEQRVTVRILLDGNDAAQLEKLHAGYNVECEVKY